MLYSGCSMGPDFYDSQKNDKKNFPTNVTKKTKNKNPFLDIQKNTEKWFSNIGLQKIPLKWQNK